MDCLIHRLAHRSLRGLGGILCCLWSLSSSAGVGSFEVALDGAGGRAVPVTVTHPAGDCSGCSLIVFSHGAYSAPERHKRLFEAWAEAGFVVVSALHVDSELNPTRDDYDPRQTMLTRLEDFALMAAAPELRDTLAERGLTVEKPIVAAGHSYGALIAQVAGGASLIGFDPLPEELLAIRPLVTGVIALSPPGPFETLALDEDWARIDRPMLVVTGTTDILPGFLEDWRLHLASFEASVQAPAYALVFDGQDHYFNGSFCRPKEDIEPATVSALQTLNEAVIQLSRAFLAGELPARDDWKSTFPESVDAQVRLPSAAR